MAILRCLLHRTFHSIRELNQIITIYIITKKFYPLLFVNLTLAKNGLFLIKNIKAKSGTLLILALKFNLPLI